MAFSRKSLNFSLLPSSIPSSTISSVQSTPLTPDIETIEQPCSRTSPRPSESEAEILDEKRCTIYRQKDNGPCDAGGCHVFRDFK